MLGQMQIDIITIAIVGMAITNNKYLKIHLPEFSVAQYEQT